MEITEVKVFPVEEEKLKAYVSIVLDRCFMVNDIKIIRGKDGLFISMPSRRKKNGEFKDVAHPLNNETRRWMESRILGEYELVRSGKPRPAASEPAPPPQPAPPESPASPAPEAGRSVEEVAELHLRDSFWSVT